MLMLCSGRLVTKCLVLMICMLMVNYAVPSARAGALDLSSEMPACNEIWSRRVFNLASYGDWELKQTGIKYAIWAAEEVNGVAGALVLEFEADPNSGGRPVILARSAELSSITFNDFESVSVRLQSNERGRIRVAFRDSMGRVFFNKKPIGVQHASWSEVARPYSDDSILFHGKKPENGLKPPYRIDYIQLIPGVVGEKSVVKMSRLLVNKKRGGIDRQYDEGPDTSWLHNNCNFEFSNAVTVDVKTHQSKYPIEVLKPTDLEVIFRAEGVQAPYTGRISVHRYGAAEEVLWEREIESNSHDMPVKTIPYRFKTPGVYAVTATVLSDDDRVLVKKSRPILVWDPPGNDYLDTKPTFFGMMYLMDRFGEHRQNDLQLMRDAGVKVVRFPFRWSEIERRKGIINWMYVEGMLNKLLENGFTPMPMVFYTPDWAARDLSTSEYAEISGGRRKWVVPSDVRGLSSFVKNVASEYKDNKVIWEIWNEPTESQHWIGGGVDDYIGIFSSAYNAIKSVAPEAKVITAGIGLLATENQHFAPSLVASLGNKKVDGFSVHSYGGYRQAEKTIETANELLAKYGLEKGVWVNEIGYLSDPGDASGELRRSAVLVKSAVISRFMGADNFTWFIVRNYPESANSPNDNYALISPDGYARPPLLAYAAAVKFLAGVSPIGKVVLSDHISGYEFSTLDRKVLISWSDEEDRAAMMAIPMREGYTLESISDMFGGDVQVVGDSFAQGSSPIFIVFTKD